MSGIGAVPAQTRLSLPPGDWATSGGVLRVTYLDLRTVEVGGSPEGMPGWVRVRGHNLECRWPSVCCPHPWCLEVAVRVEALYDALNA